MIGTMQFFDYAIYDEQGKLVGVRDDAPPEIKREYKQFLEIQEEAKKHGRKI